MTGPMPITRRQFGAAALGVVGAAGAARGAAAQPYPDGLLIYDGEEYVELAAYASLQPSGLLTMAFGRVEEIPAADRIPMLICNLGMWSVGSIWFTSHRVFVDGRAERRRLTFALNRVNIRTTRLRIRTLEEAGSLQELIGAVKAGPDNPAYAAFAVTNGAIVRHYLVQMRAPDVAHG